MESAQMQQYRQELALACSANEAAAAFAPRALLAPDAPAPCSDISDNQLLALTDTTSLTADQLDRRHHLLRHSLPDEARGESVLVHFEAGSTHEAVKLIKKMSQRDLQAKFKLVYGAKTFSNNNNWLRRKLFEAIGADPAKGAVKKAAAAAGAGARRRRGAAARAPARSTRAVAPRAAARAAAAAAAASHDWFGIGQQAEYSYQRQQYAGQYVDEHMQQYGEDGEEEEEDHDHVCEALLALGEAAASLDDSSSDGSQPSVSVAEQAALAEEAGLTSDAAGGNTSQEEEAGEGPGAFHRLLLEQHEQQHLAARRQQQQQVAAAAAAAAHHQAGMAEWLAAMQQHAAAVAAGATPGGESIEQQHAVAQMQAAAAAAAASMHHPMLGGWPGSAAAYGMHHPMLPLFQPAAMQHSVLSTLRHIMVTQQQHVAPVPPLFAAAK